MKKIFIIHKASKKLLFFLGGFFILLSFFWFLLPLFIKFFLLQELDKIGIKQADLTIQTITFKNIQLKNITLGHTKRIYIGTIIANYNLKDLFKGKVENILIDNAAIDLTNLNKGTNIYEILGIEQITTDTPANKFSYNSLPKITFNNSSLLINVKNQPNTIFLKEIILFPQNDSLNINTVLNTQIQQFTITASAHVQLFQNNFYQAELNIDQGQYFFDPNKIINFTGNFSVPKSSLTDTKIDGHININENWIKPNNTYTFDLNISSSQSVFNSIALLQDRDNNQIKITSKINYANKIPNFNSIWSVQISKNSVLYSILDSYKIQFDYLNLSGNIQGDLLFGDQPLTFTTENNLKINNLLHTQTKTKIKEVNFNLPLHIVYNESSVKFKNLSNSFIQIINLNYKNWVNKNPIMISINPLENKEYSFDLDQKKWNSIPPFSIKLSSAEFTNKKNILILSFDQMVLDYQSLNPLNIKLLAKKIEINWDKEIISIPSIQNDFTQNENKILINSIGMVKSQKINFPISFTHQTSLDNKEITGQGVLKNQDKNISINLKTTYSPEQTKLTITMNDIILGPGGITKNDLMVMKNSLDDLSGRINLKGYSTWDKKGKNKSDLSLKLDNISFKNSSMAVQGLTGVIKFDALTPFLTPKDQKIAVALIDFGLPITNGELSFDFGPGNILNIGHNQFTLVEGQVNLVPQSINLNDPEQKIILAVHNIGLAPFLKLIDLPGLSASGILDGEIPIIIGKDYLLINNGVLKTAGEGVIQYNPKDSSIPIDQNATTQLVFEALKDLHYKQLAFTINRYKNAEFQIDLKVDGSSPNFYNSYPLVFNFSLQGKLDEILKKSLMSYQLPETISKNLIEFNQAK
ncbi:MAG: YdbH domain-containing protein [Alphaproteobacteria bacterium]|nr:YdbH domain-containing protein [Alphaproteobacteria bacterium]